MGARTPALKVIQGGDEHPLRTGWCRRAGCAEPAVDLGFCRECLTLYHRRRDVLEADLSRRAAAARRELMRDAGPDVNTEWAFALAEHLAAQGKDASLYETLVSALLDFTRDSASERAGLRAIG